MGLAAEEPWIAGVLHFWFTELRPKDWWSGAPAIDALIGSHFALLLDSLSTNPPRSISLDARGHLAAVLVFDQFSRHLHRGTQRAFSNDRHALILTLDAIDRGLDESLPRPGRQFLYMPLMHSEDEAMQARSVEVFEALGDSRALRSAQSHRETVARFGRFPARNAALGRPSTAAELEFLTARGTLG